ncbi:unnamed protein product [Symbiodinium sp. CCMP2456]|nr:unnamed protein product [Symbiodinium sp. CCMP2456]
MMHHTSHLSRLWQPFLLQVVLLLYAMPADVQNPVALIVFQLPDDDRDGRAQAATAACTSATDSEEQNAFLQTPGHDHGATMSLMTSLITTNPEAAVLVPVSATGEMDMPTTVPVVATAGADDEWDICKAAVAGFLRDRGGNMHITKDWALDGSLSLQKVVLLNLVRLRELQIEYCPLLRKSEDLALSYEVILATGHLLKCQCYAYRAIHLERGGAEEVRRECRGGSSSEPSRLLLGGRSALPALPTPRQRATVEALLTWMARSRSGLVDHHGDFNDGAEEASEALLDTNGTMQKPCQETQGESGPEAQKACGVQPSDAGALKSGPVGWLRKLPKGEENPPPTKRRRT